MMSGAGVCFVEVILDAVLVVYGKVEEAHPHAYLTDSVADLSGHDYDWAAVIKIKSYFETRARRDRLIRLNKHTAYANIF